MSRLDHINSNGSLGGVYSEAIGMWRRSIADALPDRKPDVWRNAVHDCTRFRVDRDLIADAMTELAISGGIDDLLDGEEGIQRAIETEFEEADRQSAAKAAGLVAGTAWRDRLPVGSTNRFADRFKLVPLAAIELDDGPLWLVDGLIPAGPSLGVIFGKPKSGKTFMTADLVLHVAMGRDYCGCCVRQGAIVYLTNEGIRGFRRRMVAMREHHKAGADVPFYTAHAMPNLGTVSGDAAILIALIRSAIPDGTPIAAIIIDTLARALIGLSDSDGAAVGVFVDNCDVIARAFDCFVGVVHHSPRGDDSRSRGSNVLDGAADVIVSVVRDEVTGIATATVEAQKDGEHGASWRFQLTQVEIGTRNKNPCCAPVCATLGTVVKREESATRAQQRLTASQRRFVDLLAEAVLEQGKPITGSTIVPTGIKVVTREQLKKCLQERGFLDPDKAHSSRTIFNRLLNDLAGKHIIGTTAEHVWLPKR